MAAEAVIVSTYAFGLQMLPEVSLPEGYVHSMAQLHPSCITSDLDGDTAP